MRVVYRVGFDERDQIDAILRDLGIRYKKSPLFGNHYLINFNIDESDSRWPEVAELASKRKGVRGFDTYFETSEILAAEWVRLMPAFQQLYPQPEGGMKWKEFTYSNQCPTCGIGFRQKDSFRLPREPRMGKYSFLCLYWTYTLFAVAAVVDTFHEAGIRGFEVWPAVLHKTGETSKVVRQLLFPHIAEAGLGAEDMERPETCLTCGVTKYGYHRRGFMHLRRESLRTDLDFQVTHEWFGSGGFSGHREILVSNQVARLILERGWRGVRMKPVELV